jgi:hypothetical protein
VNGRTVAHDKLDFAVCEQAHALQEGWGWGWRRLEFAIMPVTSKSHPPPSAVSASIDAFVARKKKRTGQEILELFEMMMAQCGFFESALVCSQGSASCAQRNE